jgi:hypothetical protein
MILAQGSGLPQVHGSITYEEDRMNISRRNFMWTSAGAAGVGLVLGSSAKPLCAEEEVDRACPVEPQPIPHTHATPFGTTLHNFLPGPVEGIDPDTGHDPSVITDFSGVIAQADLELSGTGTDLNTGDSAPYGFHAEIRCMQGKFRAADGNTHSGTFAFI